MPRTLSHDASIYGLYIYIYIIFTYKFQIYHKKSTIHESVNFIHTSPWIQNMGAPGYGIQMQQQRSPDIFVAATTLGVTFEADRCHF